MKADAPTQSPTELARQAYQRGDRYFQIDLAVSVTEIIEKQGTLRTRSYHPQLPPDHLGQIEEQGWTLKHVSTSYVVQQTSTVMLGVGENPEALTMNPSSRCTSFVGLQRRQRRRT